MNAFEVISLLLMGALVWLWFDSLQAREAGVRGAQAACRREGVQLLDDTVAFRSLRLARNDYGHMALQRVYEFEYSGSGNDRYRGSVMLLGREITMLDITAHRRAALH